MAIEIATVQDLQQMKEEILQEIKKINTGEAHTSKQWLKSADVRKMLDISPTTLQTLRINGTLPYTKVGGTIYYDYAEVEKMLQKNKRNTEAADARAGGFIINQTKNKKHG